MKKSGYILLLLFTTLVLFSCKAKTNGQSGRKAETETSADDKPENNSDFPKENPSPLYAKLTVDQKAMVDFWKADKNGCQKYRDAENASAIARVLTELRANQNDVAELLGKPEENTPSGVYQVYGYFFDGACEGEKLKAGTVYCVLQIYFNAETGAWHTGTVVCG